MESWQGSWHILYLCLVLLYLALGDYHADISLLSAVIHGGFGVLPFDLRPNAHLGTKDTIIESTYQDVRLQGWHILL